MTVAYDLRFAADHFTGIGTHAHALLTALLDLPGDDRYAVLWNPAVPASRFDLTRIATHPRVTWVERPWRPLNPADPLRVALWLRDVRPDVFLSPFYLHPPAAGCPVVLTLHDVSPLAMREGLSPVGRVLFAGARRMARQAGLVLTASEFSRGELVRRAGLSPERVRTVALGVPRFAPAPPVRPRGMGDGAFALVVGENRPRKNLALVARAWRCLGGGTPIALVSAGRNHQRYASLETLAAPRAGGHDVRSLGWVSQAELTWLYGHASLVIFPSRYEGFGFPLVEAFAAGVPVVASDIPVFREVAHQAAAYVAPDDPQAWATVVERLRRDGAAQRALIEAGHARAAELSYAWTASATLAALRDVVTGDRFLLQTHQHPLVSAHVPRPGAGPAAPLDSRV